MSKNKSSLENKLYSLGLVEDDANNVLRTSTDSSATEMASAIFKITTHLKTFPNARVGRLWNNSKVNLSHILTSELMPVLNKMRIAPDMHISDLLKPNFHDNSTSENIHNAIRSLDTFFGMLNEDDHDAFNLLYGSLILLNASFSPNAKRVKESRDGNYCKFCYREARSNFDSCETHKGVNRVDGKKQLDRYLKLKKQLFKIGIADVNTEKFILKKLKTLGMPSWKTNQNADEWVEMLVRKMRLLSGSDTEIRIFSQEIANFSKDIFTPYHFSWEWPAALNGTFFRFEAYEMSKIKAPQKDVSNGTLLLLCKLWNSADINELLVNFNSTQTKSISKSYLTRRNKIWTVKVNVMRNQGISDSVIKVVLDVEILPK